MSLPWLTTIGLLPTIGAAVIWGSLLTGSRERAADLARWTALVVSLVVLALSVVLAIRFDVSRADQFQFAETHSWIPQFGVSYALGVDGIALTMVLLSTLLVPVCVLAGWHEIPGERATHFFALMLVLETFMVGVFAARDVFLFYVFFDVRGVDGAVRGTAAFIGGLAGRARRWQTGFVRSYAMSMLAGVLVVALGVLVVQL